MPPTRLTLESFENVAGFPGKIVYVLHDYPGTGCPQVPFLAIDLTADGGLGVRQLEPAPMECFGEDNHLLLRDPRMQYMRCQNEDLRVKDENSVQGTEAPLYQEPSFPVIQNVKSISEEMFQSIISANGPKLPSSCHSSASDPATSGTSSRNTLSLNASKKAYIESLASEVVAKLESLWESRAAEASSEVDSNSATEVPAQVARRIAVFSSSTEKDKGLSAPNERSQRLGLEVLGPSSTQLPGPRVETSGKQPGSRGANPNKKNAQNQVEIKNDMTRCLQLQSITLSEQTVLHTEPVSSASGKDQDLDTPDVRSKRLSSEGPVSSNAERYRPRTEDNEKPPASHEANQKKNNSKKQVKMKHDLTGCTNPQLQKITLPEETVPRGESSSNANKKDKALGTLNERSQKMGLEMPVSSNTEPSRPSEENSGKPLATCAAEPNKNRSEKQVGMENDPIKCPDSQPPKITSPKLAVSHTEPITCESKNYKGLSAANERSQRLSVEVPGSSNPELPRPKVDTSGKPSASIEENSKKNKPEKWVEPKPLVSHTEPIPCENKTDKGLNAPNGKSERLSMELRGSSNPELRRPKVDTSGKPSASVDANPEKNKPEKWVEAKPFVSHTEPIPCESKKNKGLNAPNESSQQLSMELHGSSNPELLRPKVDTSGKPSASVEANSKKNKPEMWVEAKPNPTKCIASKSHKLTVPELKLPLSESVFSASEKYKDIASNEKFRLPDVGSTSPDCSNQHHGLSRFFALSENLRKPAASCAADPKKKTSGKHVELKSDPAKCPSTQLPKNTLPEETVPRGESTSSASKKDKPLGTQNERSQKLGLKVPVSSNAEPTRPIEENSEKPLATCAAEPKKNRSEKQVGMENDPTKCPDSQPPKTTHKLVVSHTEPIPCENKTDKGLNAPNGKSERLSMELHGSSNPELPRPKVDTSGKPSGSVEVNSKKNKPEKWAEAKPDPTKCLASKSHKLTVPELKLPLSESVFSASEKYKDVASNEKFRLPDVGSTSPDCSNQHRGLSRFIALSENLRKPAASCAADPKKKTSEKHVALKSDLTKCPSTQLPKITLPEQIVPRDEPCSSASEESKGVGTPNERSQRSGLGVPRSSNTELSRSLAEDSGKQPATDALNSKNNKTEKEVSKAGRSYLACKKVKVPKLKVPCFDHTYSVREKSKGVGPPDERSQRLRSEQSGTSGTELSCPRSEEANQKKQNSEEAVVCIDLTDCPPLRETHQQPKSDEYWHDFYSKQDWKSEINKVIEVGGKSLPLEQFKRSKELSLVSTHNSEVVTNKKGTVEDATTVVKSSHSHAQSDGESGLTESVSENSEAQMAWDWWKRKSFSKQNDGCSNSEHSSNDVGPEQKSLTERRPKCRRKKIRKPLLKRRKTVDCSGEEVDVRSAAIVKSRKHRRSADGALSFPVSGSTKSFAQEVSDLRAILTDDSSVCNYSGIIQPVPLLPRILVLEKSLRLKKQRSHSGKLKEDGTHSEKQDEPPQVNPSSSTTQESEVTDLLPDLGLTTYADDLLEKALESPNTEHPYGIFNENKMKERRKKCSVLIKTREVAVPENQLSSQSRAPFVGVHRLPAVIPHRGSQLVLKSTKPTSVLANTPLSLPKNTAVDKSKGISVIADNHPSLQKNTEKELPSTLFGLNTEKTKPSPLQGILGEDSGNQVESSEPQSVSPVTEISHLQSVFKRQKRQRYAYDNPHMKQVKKHRVTDEHSVSPKGSSVSQTSSAKETQRSTCLARFDKNSISVDSLKDAQSTSISGSGVRTKKEEVDPTLMSVSDKVCQGESSGRPLSAAVSTVSENLSRVRNGGNKTPPSKTDIETTANKVSSPCTSELASSIHQVIQKTTQMLDLWAERSHLEEKTITSRQEVLLELETLKVPPVRIPVKRDLDPQVVETTVKDIISQLESEHEKCQRKMSVGYVKLQSSAQSPQCCEKKVNEDVQASRPESDSGIVGSEPQRGATTTRNSGPDILEKYPKNIDGEKLSANLSCSAGENHDRVVADHAGSKLSDFVSSRSLSQQIPDSGKGSQTAQKDQTVGVGGKPASAKTVECEKDSADVPFFNSGTEPVKAIEPEFSKKFVSQQILVPEEDSIAYPIYHHRGEPAIAKASLGNVPAATYAELVAKPTDVGNDASAGPISGLKSEPSSSIKDSDRNDGIVTEALVSTTSASLSGSLTQTNEVKVLNSQVSRRNDGTFARALASTTSTSLCNALAKTNEVSIPATMKPRETEITEVLSCQGPERNEGTVTQALLSQTSTLLSDTLTKTNEVTKVLSSQVSERNGGTALASTASTSLSDALTKTNEVIEVLTSQVCERNDRTVTQALASTTSTSPSDALTRGSEMSVPPRTNTRGPGVIEVLSSQDSERNDGTVTEALESTNSISSLNDSLTEMSEPVPPTANVAPGDALTVRNDVSVPPRTNTRETGVIEVLSSQYSERNDGTVTEVLKSTNAISSLSDSERNGGAVAGALDSTNSILSLSDLLTDTSEPVPPTADVAAGDALTVRSEVSVPPRTNTTEVGVIEVLGSQDSERNDGTVTEALESTNSILPSLGDSLTETSEPVPPTANIGETEVIDLSSHDSNIISLLDDEDEHPPVLKKRGSEKFRRLRKRSCQIVDRVPSVASLSINRGVRGNRLHALRKIMSRRLAQACGESRSWMSPAKVIRLREYVQKMGASSHTGSQDVLLSDDERDSDATSEPMIGDDDSDRSSKTAPTEKRSSEHSNPVVTVGVSAIDDDIVEIVEVGELELDLPNPGDHLLKTHRPLNDWSPSGNKRRKIAINLSSPSVTSSPASASADNSFDETVGPLSTFRRLGTPEVAQPIAAIQNGQVVKSPRKNTSGSAGSSRSLPQTNSSESTAPLAPTNASSSSDCSRNVSTDRPKTPEVGLPICRIVDGRVVESPTNAAPGPSVSSPMRPQAIQVVTRPPLRKNRFSSPESTCTQDELEEGQVSAHRKEKRPSREKHQRLWPGEIKILPLKESRESTPEGKEEGEIDDSPPQSRKYLEHSRRASSSRRQDYSPAKIPYKGGREEAAWRNRVKDGPRFLGRRLKTFSNREKPQDFRSYNTNRPVASQWSTKTTTTADQIAGLSPISSAESNHSTPTKDWKDDRPLETRETCGQQNVSFLPISDHRVRDSTPGPHCQSSRPSTPRSLLKSGRKADPGLGPSLRLRSKAHRTRSGGLIRKDI